MKKLEETKKEREKAFLVGVIKSNKQDVEAELAKLRKDLDYYEGFRNSVMKKLGNERFVANAPAAVVEGERRKLADAETKIASLSAAIVALTK